MPVITSADRSKTFETFIEGKSNALAKSMAMAFAEKKSQGNNTIYIYGDRGTGKTHILSSVAERALKTGHKLVDKELLISGTEEKHSLLVIDDLDKSAQLGKDAIRAFIEKGGRIAVSASSPPEKVLPEDLAGIFSASGRCADIQAPEEELRVAILKNRAAEESFSLPDDAARFIAGHIKNNIHNLIGGLERVKAISSLSGQEITRFSTIQALKDYIWSGDKDAN